MVQHLQETGSCPVTFADSTSHTNIGACMNSPAPDASGIIGGCRDFNGATTWITEPASLIQKNTVITLSAWFRTVTAGVIVGNQNYTYGNEISRSNNGHYTPILYIGIDGKLMGEFWQGAVHPIASSGTVMDSKWHYAVLVGDTTTQSLYLDGTFINSLYGKIDSLDQQYNQFGGGYWDIWPNAGSGWSFFKGSLEELRISTIPRSADWIATEYHNQSSPSTFYTVSSLISR
jgi:hypothetical protein